MMYGFCRKGCTSKEVIGKGEFNFEKEAIDAFALIKSLSVEVFLNLFEVFEIKD